MTIDQEPQTTPDQLLDCDTEHVLGLYAKTLQDFHEAQAAIAKAQEAIERINQGLPEGFKVGTYSAFSTNENYNEYNVGGYNKIYRQDAEGNYIVVGEVCTTGSMSGVFLGDRIVEIDGELVVINDELQLGLSVKRAVFVIDAANDLARRPFGGSEVDKFENFLLPCIQRVPPGEKVAFDCG